MASFYKYFYDKSGARDDSLSKSSLDDLKQADAIPIVMKTWKELMKNKKEVGAKIYEFVLTKEISMSRLFMNSKIDQQSELFMAMLDRVVNYLDEPNSIDSRLQDLGEMHAGKFGVKARHFKHFRTAFMRAIKIYLPWNDRREHAWMWFWNRIINIMSAAAQTNNMLLSKNLTQETFVEYASIVHASFDDAMQQNPQQFATSFYQRLLDEQPDIAKLFEDTTFDKQAAKFITMMQHAIKLLDDHQSFHRKLLKLSIQHKAYNVKIEQLQAFGDVLMAELKKVNKRNWTRKHNAAWTWYWKLVVDLFSRGLTSKKSSSSSSKKPQQSQQMQSLQTSQQSSKQSSQQSNNDVTNNNKNINNNNENQNKNINYNNNNDNSNNLPNGVNGVVEEQKADN